MVRIEEKDNEIIVRDVPLDEMLPFLISSIMFFLFAFTLFSTKENPFTTFLSLFLISSSIGCLIYFSAFSITTISVNKQNRLITVKRRSVIKNEFKVYSLKDIDYLLYVDESRDSTGNKTYHLLMPLNTGEKIELLRSNIFQDGKYSNIAKRVNNVCLDIQNHLPF